MQKSATFLKIERELAQLAPIATQKELQDTSAFYGLSMLTPNEKAIVNAISSLSYGRFHGAVYQYHESLRLEAFKRTQKYFRAVAVNKDGEIKEGFDYDFSEPMSLEEYSKAYWSLVDKGVIKSYKVPQDNPNFARISGTFTVLVPISEYVENHQKDGLLIR
ncbi:hypothetical protein QJL77_003107 [Listeria monocytogenes]|nr:hypothetical protein [Listeria monocytogenes]